LPEIVKGRQVRHAIKLRGILIMALPHRSSVVDGKLPVRPIPNLVPVLNPLRAPVINLPAFGDKG
jgi:hypothetical protein